VLLRVVILVLHFLESFINDLPSIILYSNILMYADDVILCLSFRDSSCFDLLQADLDRFGENLIYLILIVLNAKL